MIVKPVTLNEWADLQTLYSKFPDTRMCWCMYWRKTRSEWWNHAEENKECLRMVIASGKVPGILAYADGQPVAWCAITPRSELPGLDRSPTLKRIDAEPVWSITCFVIAKEYRRQGMTGILVREAVNYAARNGAKIIEAYPLLNVEGKYRTLGESFMGFASTFERLGFKQVSQRSRARNIMRLYLSSPTDKEA